MRRGGARSVAAGLGLAALAGLALAAAGGATAQEVREESVGVAPITADTGVPRDAALRAAVRDAVVRAARRQLPDDFVPPGAGRPGAGDEPSPDEWLAGRLGDDPFAYATRFRILEDRGQRPALFANEAGVESEYVVVAEVTVDAGAVRERLETLGLLAARGGGAARRVTLVLEGLRDYRPLEVVRQTLLDDHGVRSALPVEFQRGRAVLAVDTDRDATRLVADLQRSAPEGLRVVAVQQSATEATLRVEWEPPAPPAETDATPPEAPRD